VLGHKFWQRHFSGDSSVLGKSVQLVHKDYTIVGVAAPRFTWGDGDVYLPLKVTQDPVRGYLRWAVAEAGRDAHSGERRADTADQRVHQADTKALSA
jgi:MacB-like periplasmic core domain